MLLSNALEQFSFLSGGFHFDTVFMSLLVYSFLILFIFSNSQFNSFRSNLKTIILWFFYEKIFKLFINIRFNRFCLILSFLFISVFTINIFGTFTYAFSFTGIFYWTTLMATCLLTWSALISITRFNLNFLSLLVPVGTPGFLAKSLVAIETVSYFGRFVSLNVRLFINIISGHLVLKLLYSSLLVLLISAKFSMFFIIGMFGLGGLAFFIFALEIFVATLQSYIFFFLLCIYLKDCVW